MHIDCDTCLGRDTDLCNDCVVTFILHQGSSLDLEHEEMEALDLLADEGLVPRLRLVVDPGLERWHADLIREIGLAAGLDWVAVCFGRSVSRGGNRTRVPQRDGAQ